MKWIYLILVLIFAIIYSVASADNSRNVIKSPLRQPIADAAIACIGMSVGFASYEHRRRR